MLRHFRINDPYLLIMLLIMMALVALPYIITTTPLTSPELKSFVIGQKIAEGHALYSEIIDSTPPLASLFYGLCDFLFGRSLVARHIIALLILFAQSAYLGVMFVNKKVFAENTYIPSLLFSLLVFISFDFLSLMPELLAFGFILLVINNLFKEIEFRIQRDETIFALGLFTGLASLFSFSYIIYLPGAIIILIVFTRTSLRKYFLLLFGFLLPHLMLVCIYFLSDTVSELWYYFYLPNLEFPTYALISSTGLLVLCALPLFYLFVSLFILNRDARLTKYQAQIFQAMFLWFIVALIQFFLAKDLRPQSLLPLIPPVSFFLTHFLLLIRRKRIAEFNLWVLIVGVLSVAYLSRYDKIKSISYDNLILKQVPVTVKNTRLLVLAHQPNWFVHNTLATSFYDWDLCQPIFEQPYYYEHILTVSRAFEHDMPELIVDPENLMKAFFERLPNLEKKYKKSPEGYRLKEKSPER